MSDGLKDDLEEIDGVGPATAEKILELVETNPKLEKAIEKAENGDDRGAALWLRRYQND